ncbi:MAG: hypothetical protein IKX54_02080 [Lachnospiraceae bacterium]|nr:hypothetical protein [Lachnospiraceae bacterium]
MNREQFFNAIGNTDETMLKETEQLRMNAAKQDSPKVLTLVKSNSRARRRLLVVLAACLILGLGTLAAYAAGLIGRSGNVTTGTDGEGRANMIFETTVDMRIPLSEIKGDVKDSTQNMLEYWRRDNHTQEFTTPDPRASQDGFYLPITTSDPGSHAQAFSTLADAAAYIGYDKLTLPQFSASPIALYVWSSGINKNPDETTEPDYRLGRVTLRATFKINGVYAYSSATLTTDELLGSTNITESRITNGDGTDYAFVSDTVVANGREFWVVTTIDRNNPDSTHNAKEVIWVEDQVEYRLQLYYESSDQAVADQIMQDWMNSFGN